MNNINIENIFSCKDLSTSSITTYKTKLTKLNDNKPVRNLNFLLEMDKIKDKIKDFKPNTQRTYYIAIASILKCFLTNNKTNKKFQNLYNDYSKILDNYNNVLRDQTDKTNTENDNWMSKESITELYEELKKNYKDNQQSHQNFLILSLYYLNAPRRNKDYSILKIVNNYNDKLDNQYNYLDLNKNEFVFNNYKTSKKYNQQRVEVPPELMNIINEYIKEFKIKNNDFLIKDLKKNEPININNGMTVLLNRIFKKKVGSSMLRKIYLTSKYGDQAKELKEDVKNMGTSVSVAQNNYIKK
jgi:hypothetical protein